MIHITYASETGNAESLAEDTATQLSNAGFETTLSNLEDFTPEKLTEVNTLLSVVSTWGDGDPPTEAEDFYLDLKNNQSLSLSHLRYAILALGDTDYEFFCQFGKDLDRELSARGAKKLTERIDCNVDYDEEFEQWYGLVTDALSKS
jgi:sulfite reductase (NADPH) flavoprotein alpha-component|tara:strand:+ start:1416 stop:1856 length:441 start_codon:yes stop_codon:yes gene_type:complete